MGALLKAAGAARRSLYEHFGGKDGLIAEVLRRSTAEDLDKYRATMDAAGDDPRTWLLAVIDRLAEIAAAPDFHGWLSGRRPRAHRPRVPGPRGHPGLPAHPPQPVRRRADRLGARVPRSTAARRRVPRTRRVRR
ncbi:TetR family transcriptional regulator [Streptomyces sp. NPDC053474]|uniref:TetR family transcriptional regulator n=1 Tax=Streptomyces sp. NPDC053474 TaxID=3365704 RepID=UPI0037CE3AE5